jgi:hypothetical protein
MLINRVSFGTRILLTITVLSRLFILAVIILSNILISDHNPGDDVAVFTTSISKSHYTLHQILGSFTKWDSAYYLLIAKDGFYATEQLLAFFPLYPFRVQKLANMIKNLSHLFQFFYVEKEIFVVLSAVLLSNICFILSVFVLKALLTNLVLKSPFLLEGNAHYIDSRNYMYHSTYSDSDHDIKDGNDSNLNCSKNGSEIDKEIKYDRSDNNVENDGTTYEDMRLENEDLKATVILGETPTEPVAKIISPNPKVTEVLDSTANFKQLSRVTLTDQKNNSDKKIDHESVNELVDIAVVCYLCNPATVFFCTAYTESVYALLTFSGISRI